MKDILSSIVSLLVDNKDEVEVAEENVDGTVTLTLSVAKDDMGKVIGKEGKIIRSIRNVMKIPAMKQNVRVNVMLMEKNSA